MLTTYWLPFRSVGKEKSRIRAATQEESSYLDLMRLAFDTQLELMLRRLLVTPCVEMSWCVSSVRRDSREKCSLATAPTPQHFT